MEWLEEETGYAQEERCKRALWLTADPVVG
jgi:hypothetical protein